MYAIRPMRKSDLSYIIKSWVMSIRKQFPYSQYNTEAVRKYAKRVEALIETADVAVACDRENPDVILGFACYECDLYLGRETPTLHYVFVTKDLRGNGIGTALVRHAFPAGDQLIYTHITKALKNGIIKERWNLGSCDPYLIEGALYSRARQFDAHAIYDKALGNLPASGGAGWEPPGRGA